MRNSTGRYETHNGEGQTEHKGHAGGIKTHSLEHGESKLLVREAVRYRAGVEVIVPGQVEVNVLQNLLLRGGEEHIR